MCKTTNDLSKVIEIPKVICLTDAEIVHNWIKRDDREYKVFVKNRCNKIRKRVPKEQWYHVPRKHNGADLPSRGCFPKQLEQPAIQKRWLYGPEWITKSEEEWPITSEVKHFHDDPELKVPKDKESTCMIVTAKVTPTVQKLVNFENFSSMDRLVRVIAWCKRFIHNYLCKKKEDRNLEELSAEECEHSRKLCIQSVQGELKSESGFSKRAESLGLYDDEDGFMRCRGRIGKAKIPFTTRFPILLPRNHHVTELVIREAHEKVYHNGVKETLSEVRSKYWIVKGRQIVKKLLRRCVLCKKLEGLAYPSPVTSPLPEFRVGANKAFQTTGVDFCGPVYVKDIYNKGEGMHKVCVISICVTT